MIPDAIVYVLVFVVGVVVGGWLPILYLRFWYPEEYELIRWYLQ